MNFESFKYGIIKGIEKYPSNWRYGQKIFNYVDINFGIARDVQFLDHIDCFYVDDNVDSFLRACYKRIYNSQDKQ